MQTEPIATPIDVLDFWFGTEPHARVARPEWFRKSADFDAEIRRRFGVTHDTARAGGLITWESALRDRLALIVVLDQFSRNLHRDSPLAFACDARALALARQIKNPIEEANLLNNLGGVEMPAVGFAIGDVVLGELLKDRGLAPAPHSTAVQGAGLAPEHPVDICGVSRYGRHHPDHAAEGPPATLFIALRLPQWQSPQV